MIFNPDRHEPVSSAAWSERLARFAIRDIVSEAVEAGPPDDAGLYDAGVYEGVAGERYALGLLGTEVDWQLGAGQGAGWADGEVGIALAVGDRERFHTAASACIEDPWNDFCAGAAGALVAALLLGEDDIGRTAVGRLWSEWSFDSTARACLWTQRWDGHREQFLGFAHGVAGNAYALLRAARLQSLHHQAELIERVVETLERFALRDGNLVNWLPTVGSRPDEIRVQWCHGAPGVACALAGAPAHRRLDALLLGAGELVWEAGPVRARSVSATAPRATAGRCSSCTAARATRNGWPARDASPCMPSSSAPAGAVFGAATSAWRSTCARALLRTIAGRLSTPFSAGPRRPALNPLAGHPCVRAEFTMSTWSSRRSSAASRFTVISSARSAGTG